LANVKITQLPLATTPLTGTEDIPLVQGTTTKQVTVTGLFTSPVMTNPTLGVVGQADLINATGLPIASGVAGLGAGIATFLGTPSSANLRTAVTDETGSGSLVFANTPVLVAPNLGTPTFLVATNATGTAVGLTAGSAITNANLTGAVTSVGNATSLGSFTSAQLRTALTDETGAGSAVFATSPTITAPILNQINDTNNAQILGLSPTTSAVDYLVAKNGIGVGVPLHFYADGASANIGLHIQPKGTGLVTISDGTDFNKGIRFRSSGSAASAITLLDAVSTAGRVVTLPDATTTLVGRDTTDTLTNKTIAFSSNTFSGTLAIANGGTGQATANAALNALLPSQTGNASKYLQTNGTDSSWDAISLSTADITGTLGTANGGTNLTSFTSGGVVYASSSSALATGSALSFNGTTVGINTAVGNSTSLSITGDYTPNNVATFIGVQRLGGAVAGAWSYNDAQGAIQFGTTTNHSLIFLQNNSEAMRLTSSSLYTASGINVGIGLSNPAYKLETVSPAGSNITAWFRSGDATAANNAGGGFVNTSSATATSRSAGLLLDADGANSSGGDYFYLIKNGNSGSIDFLQYSNASMRFGTNYIGRAAIDMTLDSAGNLGLGVTPSAWSGYKVLDFYNTGAIAGDNGNFWSLNNAYYNGSNYIYKTSTYASGYLQTGGQHWWYTAASGTAGNAISFTQAMTLDANGNLGVGTTNPAAYGKLAVRGYVSGIGVNASTFNNVSFETSDAVNSSFYVQHGSSIVNLLSDGAMGFYTAISGTVAERARIDSSGNLLLNTTTNTYSSRAVFYNASNTVLHTETGSTGTSNQILFLNPNGIVGSITTNGSATLYNVTSDQRLKENITDADSASSLIDSLQVRKFDWKADGTHQRYGFVAQELVSVAPEAVHQPTDTEQMMAVDYSKLVPMLVKEIQSLRQRLSAANL